MHARQTGAVPDPRLQLDLDDHYHLKEVAQFNARYGYLATWPLDGLIREMSSGAFDISTARAEFSLALDSLDEK